MGFRSQAPPGDLNRRPEAPGPDLQFENSPIEPDPPAHCHTATNDRGGTAEKRFSAGKIIYVQKDPKEPIFWSGQLEPTWRGPVAGGALIFTYIGGYGFEPRHARPFLFVGFWCFGAQDATRANRRAVRGCTGKSCEFRGWPRFAIFPRFFPMRILRFMALGER